MNVIKCKNDHYYDADRYSSCPHCLKNEANEETRNTRLSSTEESLSHIEYNNSANDEPTEMIYDEIRRVSSDNADKTIGIFSFGTEAKEKEINPVVGWIVGIEGIHLGECFNIYAGRNSLGRMNSNTIVIADDLKVSREKHAWITFDPMALLYYIQPGDSSGLSYLNGEPVMEARRLSAHDILSVGSGKYYFVPLCGTDFNWEHYIK